MSASRKGQDCCGDRYECLATNKCPCGCGLYYCHSCFGAHCIRIVKKGGTKGGSTRGFPKQKPFEDEV